MAFAFLAHKKRNKYRNQIVTIQKRARGNQGRNKAKEHRLFVSARKIQRAWRRSQEQKAFKGMRLGILLAQQRWRVHNAKSQLKKLKQEAKEVGALVAKNQKAQEQAKELRIKNEELEAQVLQLQSEKKTMQAKIKQLEEGLTEMQASLEEVKKKAAEDATENAGKIAVEGAEFTEMKQQLADKTELAANLQVELEALKDQNAKQQQSAADSEARYQQLLKSTAMQSMATLGPGGMPA